MTESTILIAGVGNIFLGDDAFGVEVVNRLAGRQLPAGVLVKDFGISGLDLAYTLLDGKQAVTLIVDAAPRDGAPGSLYVIQPDLAELDREAHDTAFVEAHGMDPMQVLRMVKSMGGDLKQVLVIGCEPLTLGPEEGQMGLSEPVEHAVDEAVKLIESLVSRFSTENPVIRPV